MNSASTNADGRFNTSLPQDTTDDEKQNFVLYTLTAYCEQKWSVSSFSEFYADDFSSFTLDNFMMCDTTVRQNPRYHLGMKGMYISKSCSVDNN